MEEQTKAAGTSPKKSKSLILIIAAVVVLVGGGGFAFWKFGPAASAAKAEASEKGEESSKKKSKSKSAIKSVMHMESFVVNLNGDGETGYLRVGIDIGLNAEQADGEESKKKGAGPTPIIRDTVLTVLGKSSTSELLTADGKEKLKKELLTAIGERLPDLGIVDVFFTEFLVQK